MPCRQLKPLFLIFREPSEFFPPILTILFLKEFYQKLKYTIAPGLEKVDFTSELNVGNFLKEINSFVQ